MKEKSLNSISDVNAAKVSAKDCARGIALLGVEVIPMLFGLIKRAIAKGREGSVGKKTEIESPNARQGACQITDIFRIQMAGGTDRKTVLKVKAMRLTQNWRFSDSSNQLLLKDQFIQTPMLPPAHRSTRLCAGKTIRQTEES